MDVPWDLVPETDLWLLVHTGYLPQIKKKEKKCELDVVAYALYSQLARKLKQESCEFSQSVQQNKAKTEYISLK